MNVASVLAVDSPISRSAVLVSNATYRYGMPAGFMRPARALSKGGAPNSLAHGLQASPLSFMRARSTRVPSGTCLTRSEEHTSELQSLMRISYADFCLKKKKQTQNN